MSAFISVLKRDMCVFGTRRAGACALRERLRSPCVPIAHNQALHGVPIAHMRSGCEPDALLLATKSPPGSSLDARTLRRVRFSAGVLPRIKKQVDTAIYLLVPFGGAAENPRIRCADPHRLRALARPRLLATKSPPGSSLDARTLRRVRFSAGVLPRIKKQVDTAIYLLVPFGGAAENRTPVHESPLIGISRLSRCFSLGRVARSDTLAAP